MDIEFHGHYDKRLFFEAVAVASRPSHRKIIFRLIFGLVFVAIYIGYFYVVATKDSRTTSDILRTGRHLLMFIAAGYFLLQPYIHPYLIARRLWDDPGIQAYQRGRVSSIGVIYSGAKTEKMIPWDSYARVRKTDQFIALVTADGQLSVFPKDFFEDETAWERFKRMVDQKVVEPI